MGKAGVDLIYGFLPEKIYLNFCSENSKVNSLKISVVSSQWKVL